MGNVPNLVINTFKVFNNLIINKKIKIIVKKMSHCTAPKKLDTFWGYFYGKKSQV